MITKFLIKINCLIKLNFVNKVYTIFIILYLSPFFSIKLKNGKYNFVFYEFQCIITFF